MRSAMRATAALRGISRIAATDQVLRADPNTTPTDRISTHGITYRVDSDSLAGGVFTAEGDIYRVVAGERVQAVTYAPPFEQIVDGNAYLSGGNINLRWRRVLKSGGDIQFQAYYDRTNRFEPNLAERRNTYSIDFVAHQPAAGRQLITWGLSARFSHAQNPEVVSGLVFLPDSRTDNLMTAFFQDEIMIVDHRLSLVAGTKMLHTNFTGLVFEPSVRLLWTPSDRQNGLGPLHACGENAIRCGREFLPVEIGRTDARRNRRIGAI